MISGPVVACVVSDIDGGCRGGAITAVGGL